MALSLSKENTTFEKDFCIGQQIDELGLTLADLARLPGLSPYLILDGHRTGVDGNVDPAQGYMEGAIFSLRFARIFQEMGGKRSTFLIHTLRNYSTMSRMKAIFNAVEEIGKKFITTARQSDIRLRYYGYDVRGGYALADLINTAEKVTEDCSDFELNFLTNYSDRWANENFEAIEDLPEISVIGRFTKGHYSGAGIPGHAEKANFIYIQQASVSANWSDEQIMTLILTLLKSHLALHGFVGGKTYTPDEKEEIREFRELKLFDETIRLNSHPTKRITSFSPKGPMTVYF